MQHFDTQNFEKSGIAKKSALFASNLCALLILSPPSLKCSSPPLAKDGKRGLQYNSFYYRCQRTWNNLPSNVVDAEDVNLFKKALDSHWEGHPMMYDHTYRESTEDNKEEDEN